MGNDTNKKIELENSLTRDILSEQIIELSDQISSIPEFPKLTEYKTELQTIISKLGNEDILSAISTLEAKIQPVTVESKEIDIMPILEQLKAIQGEMKPLELPEFKFGQNGRLLVSDVGGGGTRAVSVVDSGGDDVNIAKEAKQDDLITELKLKADLTETQPVSNASLPLPAGASTEEKQDDVIAAIDAIEGSVLVITNAIEETAYDLTSSFSEVTSIASAFILDNIELNFTTAEEKTITITSSNGTVIWSDTNTDQSVYLSNMNIAFSGTENITVAVTAFSSAGTMDCILRTRNQ